MLFSSPCAMKLEKRMSSPNVHLTFDDILLARFMTMPGAHAPVCEESVSSIWHQLLNSSTGRHVGTLLSNSLPA